MQEWLTNNDYLREISLIFVRYSIAFCIHRIVGKCVIVGILPRLEGTVVSSTDN